MKMALAIVGLAMSFAAHGAEIVNGHGTGLLRKPVAASVEFAEPKAFLMAALPASYDSRAEGFVTRIKNQGSCGSCWSFARTAAFEAALIKAGRATKDALDLAEQDALVNDKTAYGCNGGFMDASFEVRYGTTTEALCPYKGTTRWQSCRGAKYAKASRWAMIGGRSRAPSIEELKAAIVEHKVLAVTVAACNSFSPGRDGRITTCGCRSVNHMVNLAGYRTLADGTTEFLIKNSWGTGWGQGGYAWSRQACNKLASSAGDAALFIAQ